VQYNYRLLFEIIDYLTDYKLKPINYGDKKKVKKKNQFLSANNGGLLW